MTPVKSNAPESSFFVFSLLNIFGKSPLYSFCERTTFLKKYFKKFNKKL